VNTSRARSACAAGSVAHAARTASAFAAMNCGWSKKCRSLINRGARSPTALRARAMSSWYWRQAE
jgi:hypothetical protein